MRFSVSHRKKAKFARRGLRSYFEYRDLGIKRATRGKVVAHVIRARPGKAPHGEWHAHDCKVQFVYVLKGWVLFEYEGIGKVKMKAGSCFYQPPKIRHRELGHSRDLEMIEVVSPAKFRTYCFGETCSQKVTGPSFTRLTCMWAPKRPVATRGTHSSAFSTKRRNRRSADSGPAALEKLGRAPLLVSAASVNCGTASSCPRTSFSDRFILPSASGKMR